MSWKEEVAELARRRELAAKMGGEEGIARQRERGKLTVRERITAISDPDSFEEFMGLVGNAQYENDRLSQFTPKASVEGITTLLQDFERGRGRQRVAGRDAGITADDRWAQRRRRW